MFDLVLVKPGQSQSSDNPMIKTLIFFHGAEVFLICSLHSFLLYLSFLLDIQKIYKSLIKFIYANKSLNKTLRIYPHSYVDCG